MLLWAQNCVLHTKDTQMIRDFLPWAFLGLMFSREQRKHDTTATPCVEARGAATGHSGDNLEQTEETRHLFFPFQTKVKMPYFFKVSSRSCSREAFITNTRTRGTADTWPPQTWAKLTLLPENIQLPRV